MDEKKHDSKRASVLRYLQSAQDMGEGLTPGRLRAYLNLSQNDFIWLMQSMEEEGLVAVLPAPPHRMGSGRSAPIIHCPVRLRGPETTREMLQTKFIPIATDEPNQFYILDKANRGKKVELAASGETAVSAVIDSMFKMGKRSFSKEQLVKKMNISVPAYIVDFVWGRFTYPIFEETQLNGGWVYDPGIKSLTARTGPVNNNELNSLQHATKTAFTYRINDGWNRYIAAGPDKEELNAERRPVFEEQVWHGPFPQAIFHPRLTKALGDPAARQKRCLEDDITGKTWDHPFYGWFSIWQNLCDEDYRETLLAAATTVWTTDEALKHYESKHAPHMEGDR